jgi:hypothetical protein
MKKQTKNQLKRITLYALIFVFVAGSFLLYLPLSQPAPQATPVPVNNVPANQNPVATPPVQ